MYVPVVFTTLRPSTSCGSQPARLSPRQPRVPRRERAPPVARPPAARTQRRVACGLAFRCRPGDGRVGRVGRRAEERAVGVLLSAGPLAHSSVQPAGWTTGRGRADAAASRPAFAVLFTLALLSKPVVVALAPALLIVIWWKRGRVEKRDVLSVAPMLALGLAAGLLAVYIEHFYGGDRRRLEPVAGPTSPRGRPVRCGSMPPSWPGRRTCCSVISMGGQHARGGRIFFRWVLLRCSASCGTGGTGSVAAPGRGAVFRRAPRHWSASSMWHTTCIPLSRITSRTRRGPRAVCAVRGGRRSPSVVERVRQRSRWTSGRER